MSARQTPVVVVLALVAGCYSPPPSMVVLPPPLREEQIAPPPPRQPGAAAVTSDTSVEITVSIDTHGRETDVREILGFLGRSANLHFVFSPDINRKVRITLNDVPVSAAIETVLAEANLTLEGTTSLAPPPTPAVVFYQLPVNIDSLSVESIMKRFGVGRAVAEVLVQSRSTRP